ncbi:MAG: hypothetical protein ABR84_00505 [Cryomorphaceae bacterium BACL21 MAG-121220-bin10]|jgi:cation:H+ antiporter|nr:MAG: hypothetical protein ABR84_00505 [Cryomorphaceae bacterium BACL21 MAG-121220-bin10]
MSIVYLFLGLTLLVVGGEFLVRAAVGLSFKLNLSKMVIGLTVVSFATSAPELIVSLTAAMDGFGAIALGNVIGSNIANIGLVLGITALITPLAIERDFYRLNWPAMLFVSLLFTGFLIEGDGLSRGEGAVLFACLIVYLVLLIRRTKNTPRALTEDIDGLDSTLAQVSSFKIAIWLLIGAVALYWGSEWLVEGAVAIAVELGVSQRVIAVTIIAVGTSVPELAASVIAALRQEKALSLGNLIGSNIFNIACVLGLTSMIHPLKINANDVLPHDLFWMIGFVLVTMVLIFLPKRHQIGRYEGLFLLIAYATFISLTIR